MVVASVYVWNWCWNPNGSIVEEKHWFAASENPRWNPFWMHDGAKPNTLKTLYGHVMSYFFKLSKIISQVFMQLIRPNKPIQKEALIVEYPPLRPTVWSVLLPCHLFLVICSSTRPIAHVAKVCQSSTINIWCGHHRNYYSLSNLMALREHVKFGKKIWVSKGPS